MVNAAMHRDWVASRHRSAFGVLTLPATRASARKSRLGSEQRLC
jgi:hypothetical protein